MPSRPDKDEQTRGLPIEVGLIWLALLVVACEVLVTYARLPARELYHVSGSGLVGGASRALVFTNFPVALIALAILAVSFERLRGRLNRASALIAAALCSAVFWPGVVNQANLDARWVNMVAALGVVLALLLTVAIARRDGLTSTGRRRGDRARLGLTLALLVVAAPWVAADLGFFLDGFPLLGQLFQTGTYIHSVLGLPPFPPAVHHGHHHGMDGFLLVLSALLLSRAVASVAANPLRRAVSAYLALMFCYGLGNIANDFWTEQVVKRGWTTWHIPNVLEPSLSTAWAIIVLAATALLVVTRSSPSRAFQGNSRRECRARPVISRRRGS